MIQMFSIFSILRKKVVRISYVTNDGIMKQNIFILSFATIGYMEHKNRSKDIDNTIYNIHFSCMHLS